MTDDSRSALAGAVNQFAAETDGREDGAKRFTPATCPHCAYDRRFPGFEGGGWMQQDNNGPIVSCPLCNDNSSHPIGET